MSSFRMWISYRIKWERESPEGYTYLLGKMNDAMFLFQNWIFGLNFLLKFHQPKLYKLWLFLIIIVLIRMYVFGERADLKRTFSETVTIV